MISKAGAGPDPIPQKELNVENLTAAINFILRDDAQHAAQDMARQIENEVCSIKSL
jgi:sterol 3beta-glucosyltransferase